MTTINISIVSSGMDQTQATNLVNFLVSLGSAASKTATATMDLAAAQMVLSAEELSGEEQPKMDKPTRNRTKKEKAPEPEDVNETEVTEPEILEPEVKNITLQEIRSLVFVKKDAHKDAIKAELKRIGADSIPNVQPKDYPAFHKFLEGLE